MDKDTSSLPLLRPNRISKRSENQDNYSEEINPAHLKREINRLYPRIENIKNEIENLRFLIPSDLNKILMGLRQDIDNVANKAFTDDEPKIEVLQKRLNELEDQLKMRIDVSVFNSSANIKKRINDFIVTRNSSLHHFQLEHDSDINLDNKLNDIEKMLSDFQQKNNSRLSTVEKRIGKIVSQDQSTESEIDKFNAIKSTIDKNRQEISEMRLHLAKMRIEYDRIGVMENIQQQIIQHPKRNKATKSIEISDVPDLTGFIADKHQEVIDMNKQYQGIIAQLKQRMSGYNEKLHTLDGQTNEIVTITVTLESRIAEAEALCKSLIDQVNILDSRIQQSPNSNLIIKLKETILKEQQTIQSEIQNLQKLALKSQAFLNSKKSGNI